MVILFQVIEILRSRNLCALCVFNVVSTLVDELDYLVGSFSVQIELSYRVLGISNNLSQNKVSNQKFSMLDSSIVYLGQLLLVVSHP